jgi:hypothetical protein
MEVRVYSEGAGDEDGFEDKGEDPRGQVRFGGRGLGVEQRDEEQAVDEEGADQVDLRASAKVQRAEYREHTTTALPAHQCSSFLARA